MLVGGFWVDSRKVVSRDTTSLAVDLTSKKYSLGSGTTSMWFGLGPSRVGGRGCREYLQAARHGCVPLLIMQQDMLLILCFSEPPSGNFDCSMRVALFHHPGWTLSYVVLMATNFGCCDEDGFAGNLGPWKLHCSGCDSCLR